MSHNNHMLDAGWLQAAGEQTIGAIVRKEYDALDKLFSARQSDQSMERAKIEKGIFHTGGK